MKKVFTDWFHIYIETPKWELWSEKETLELIKNLAQQWNTANCQWTRTTATTKYCWLNRTDIEFVKEQTI